MQQQLTVQYRIYTQCYVLYASREIDRGRGCGDGVFCVHNMVLFDSASACTTCGERESGTNINHWFDHTSYEHLYKQNVAIQQSKWA